MAAEEIIHRAVVEHLRRRAKPDCVWFHPPNGGKRHIGAAVKLQRMGVVPGVSDLILLHGGEAFALEIKAERGRMSPAQKEFQGRFVAAGGYAMTGYGVDECLSFLSHWGLLK